MNIMVNLYVPRLWAFCDSHRLAFHQMKTVEKLVNGKEIGFEELEGKADQAQIKKVCQCGDLELCSILCNSLSTLPAVIH